MKKFSTKIKLTQRNWYVVDAENKILGRFATQLAHILRGKHKAEYAPHLDVGDYLIVVNAEKISVTGNKINSKIYYRHTGYVGGIKRTTLSDMISRHPERVIEIAVRGMLPKGPLGRSIFRKLKVYVGTKHNHAAQKPQVLNLVSRDYK
ncbi:50S ribosomal protein L13 [Sodalis sp. CWE]|uniref:50S ribosomal protein L13 n=1 Tax=Sodalis sp. CWE TaxID=2803816 RepID=UPI001C7D2B89|nr:50S ribosomal protein L13 [Sodalis sp. CWE]MBX4180836.1 50S ribosomal protein L13 [Sodalis sp. CWE]